MIKLLDYDRLVSVAVLDTLWQIIKTDTRVVIVDSHVINRLRNK